MQMPLMSMEVRFTNLGRACRWDAVRPPRTRVPGPTMAAGADLPHDLATFVIEGALAIRHGFWGCIADGATFRSLGRRRTQPGVAVIRRHAGELDDAERRVHEVYAAWRRDEPTPCTVELDRTLAAWRSLPEGGELVLTWRQPPAGSTNAAGKRRRRSARL